VASTAAIDRLGVIKSIFHTFEWLVCFRQSALAR
jgi:hypothetical protein